MGGLIIPFIGIKLIDLIIYEHSRIRRLTDMNRLPSLVRQHLAALRGLLLFTVITGIIYPWSCSG